MTGDVRRAEIEALTSFQFTLTGVMHDYQITRDDLATRMKVTRPYVDRLFRARANPSIKVLARIYHALNLPLNIG
jgi:transcriptional regulator with XRE-family HTH domain